METEKKKLTDNQLRLAQGIAGVLAAAALMVSILISPNLEGLLQYLFVVVFIVITMGRRWFENKYRMRLNFFNLVMIEGILIGIYIFLAVSFYNPESAIALSDTLKALILIGALLVILLLGFGLPIWMHFRRKAKGITVPIRIPEKTEEEEKADQAKSGYGGRSSIAQQMAEMQKELEEKDHENN